LPRKNAYHLNSLRLRNARAHKTAHPPFPKPERHSVARRNILILVGLVAAAGGAAAYYATRPLAVQVAKAQSGPAADLVYATGYVEAQQPVSVSSRITAPVAQVLVKEGDAVRRGQALAMLSADEQRAAIFHNAGPSPSSVRPK